MDTASIQLSFENGSCATVHYFANGHRSFPKERVEVFQSGRTYVLDNFRKLKGYGAAAVKASAVKQDKGQDSCCKAFIESLSEGKPAPIEFSELMEVSKATLTAWDQIAT